MLHKLGLGALLAATAGAVLVPPAVDIATDGPIFRITVPIEPESSHRRPLDNLFPELSRFRHAVPKGPDFPAQPKVADKGIWKTYLLPIKDSQDSLFLNISTPGGTIQLNDYRLYPLNIPDAINIYRVPTKVGQHFKPSEHRDKVLRVTQWSANTPDVQPVSKAEELLKIRISIDSVEYQHVNVQDVIVDAIKRADGSILLVGVKTADPDPMCARFPLLCSLRSKTSNALANLRGKIRGNCHKHGMAMGRPGGRISHHQRPPHGHWHKVHKHKGHKHHKGSKHQPMGAHASSQQGRPKGHHHMMPHGQGRHHSRFACVLRKIGRVALHVVLPILVGLLAGVMAYVLGMLIGTAIVLVWARIRGRGAYAPVALEEADLEAETVVFEKDGFVDEDAAEEPLPEYVEVENKE